MAQTQIPGGARVFGTTASHQLPGGAYVQKSVAPAVAAQLSGGAQAVASAYGALSTAIPLSGSAVVSASGAGTLTAGAAGSLAMTVTPNDVGVHNLTTLGGLDWIVYPGTTPVRKSGGGSLINVTHVGSFSDNVATDGHATSTWSDGSGTASGSTPNVIYSTTGVGIGYRITLPADTTPRVATIVAGTYNTNQRITASLSDGSASQVVDSSSIIGSSAGGSQFMLTIPYRAASAGQTLTVEIVATGSAQYSNTSFQSASLSLAAAAAVLAGAAAALATGTGALSTAIPLSGAAQTTATATGALTTAVRPAGSASATATATGSLATSVKLDGAAAGMSTGSGALTTAIPLAGAAASVASAGGALATAIPLSGSAQAVALATGTLAGSSAALGGSAVATATATGALATRIVLSGGAQAVAQAYGALASGGVALAGSAQTRATASGALATSVPLSGVGTARATAAGVLATAIPLVGTASDSAAGEGGLATRIMLGGSTVAVATAAAGTLVSDRPAGGGVDISQIDPARVVVFDGSGSRIVPFEGSGSRVVVFGGSGARTNLNGVNVKLPTLIGTKWTVDRDPDEISHYGADITQELLDRATTAVSVELVLVGVVKQEDPQIQVVTGDAGSRTYVAAFLGPVAGDPPDGWKWVARVTCANGERFDKTTWFNKVDP